MYQKKTDDLDILEFLCHLITEKQISIFPLKKSFRYFYYAKTESKLNSFLDYLVKNKYADHSIVNGQANYKLNDKGLEFCREIVDFFNDYDVEITSIFTK